MKQASDTAGAAALAPVQLIKVTDIVPDPNNRKDHARERLQLLADEIAVDGLLQPIVVRPADNGKYMLIAGERRWRAFQLLKRDTIPASVHISDGQKGATRKRVAENFHREDLTPIEKARDLEQLFKDGMTQAEVAAFVGAKDQSTISNMMRLLKLPKRVQDWLQDGSLTAAHGKALLRFEGRNKLIEAIAERAIDEGASTKMLEKGLPFVEKLVWDGYVFDFDWTCGAIKELPAKWQNDADFIEAENSYGEIGLYCLEPNKGKTVEEEIDKARREQQNNLRSGSSATSTGGRAPGMTAAQLAERKRTIEKNKARRAAIDATCSKAVAYLSTCTHGASPTCVMDVDRVVKVVVDSVLEDFRNGRRQSEAAKALGLKAGSDKEFSKLSAEDQLRVAAASVLLRHCEEAKRNAWEVPEEAIALAGGVSKPITPKVKATVPSAKPPKKKARRAVITDDTRYQVKRLTEAGKTGAEIAKAVGISLPSVQNIKKALGLIRR